MRKANYSDYLSLLLGNCRRYLVEGDSMFPTLKDGDFVLIEPTKNLQVGDIVVAEHPYKKTQIIKRITNISANDRFFLSGDNLAESNDSRTYGEILRKNIVGKVICLWK